MLLMTETMTQEIRDRLTTLETKHEERHNQTLALLSRQESTQERIAGAVESLVENQAKMAHLGGRVDNHEVLVTNHDKAITELKTKQGIIWKALGVLGTAITSVIVAAAFKMWGS